MRDLLKPIVSSIPLGIKPQAAYAAFLRCHLCSLSILFVLSDLKVLNLFIALNDIVPTFRCIPDHEGQCVIIHTHTKKKNLHCHQEGLKLYLKEIDLTYL